MTATAGRAARRTRARVAAGLAAASLAAASLAAAAPPAAAQTAGNATISGPPGNPIREGTPAFTITTSGFQPNEFPLRLTLQIAMQSSFTTLIVDTTVTGGPSASIVVPRLLPEQITIWWRARVLTAQGQPVLGEPVGPRQTSRWLTLIAPNELNGTTLDTKRPTFLWTSVSVRPPVEPWRYQIIIRRSLDGFPVMSSSLFDTLFTAFADLESNTSYRWSVSATTSTSDSTHADSRSFVILDPNAPVATVLYVSFPNPFPNDRVAATCIWFDLRAQSDVRLEVLDLRGNHVAKILPGRGLGATLPAGRYGRAAVGSSIGCDDRLTWDGRDDGGRYVPPGVYLIRFRGDGVTETKKVLWKGR